MIKFDAKKQINNLILLSFAALVFLMPITKSGIEISFFCILIFAVIKQFVDPISKETIRKALTDRTNLLLLLFLIMIAVSAFSSGELMPKSLRALVSKWGEGILLYFFVRFFLDKEKVRKLFLVLTAATLLVCINGLYQKVTGVGFIRGFEIIKTTELVAVRSTFTHYNDFASFVVAMFFISSGVLCTVKSEYKRYLFVLFGALILTNTALTFSRGSWIAFIAACVFLAVFTKNITSRITSTILVTFFMIGIFVFPPLRDRFILITQKGGDASRYDLWKIAIEMFKASPITGCGLGLFMDNYSKYTHSEIKYAHNCYLQILAETGIIGFGSFLMFIGSSLFKLFKKFKNNSDPVFLGAFLGLIAFLVHAFFDTQLYSLQLSIFFWFLIGSLMVLSDEDL